MNGALNKKSHNSIEKKEENQRINVKISKTCRQDKIVIRYCFKKKIF